MKINGLFRWSAGIKSDELSKPHGANSFIHLFIFSVNRQRRIGGVATENCGWITR